MTFPMTIESQEDLDGLFKERLTRQREQFEGQIAELNKQIEGIPDLTKRVEEAEAAKVAAEKDRDDATTRATDAEAKVGTFEQKEQVASWRTEVASAKGVPASALRGTTREELEAHADELKPLLTAQESPVIPNQGKQPETQAPSADDWIRDAARAS